MNTTKVKLPTATTVPDNRLEKLSPRLRAIISAIWNLNQQEKSYLDRHFMLRRTALEFMNYHVDDHVLSNKVLNGGISYDVIFHGISSWQELSAVNDVIDASFRYQRAGRFAVVIVRRAVNIT